MVYFLTYLKQINKETEIAESTLKNSMRNKELLKMLSLEKSLVYFTTALKANELVMEKLMQMISCLQSLKKSRKR